MRPGAPTSPPLARPPFPFKDRKKGKAAPSGGSGGAKSGGGAKPAAGSGSGSGGSKGSKGGGSAVVELTEVNFKALVLESNDHWLVEFYAPWCVRGRPSPAISRALCTPCCRPSPSRRCVSLSRNTHAFISCMPSIYLDRLYLAPT